MANQETVPTFKQDAMIPIELGTAYIKRLYDLLLYLTTGKSKEDLEQLDMAMQAGNVNEPWMVQYMTVAALIHHIEHVAQEKGFVEHIDINAMNN